MPDTKGENNVNIRRGLLGREIGSHKNAGTLEPLQLSRRIQNFKDRRNRTKGAGYRDTWDAWWTMSSGGNKTGGCSDIAYQSIVNYFGGDRTSYFANQHTVPLCFSIRRG